MLWLSMGCFGDAARGECVEDRRWDASGSFVMLPLGSSVSSVVMGCLLQSRVFFAKPFHDHALQRRAHTLSVFHYCLQATDRTSRFSTPRSGRTRSYEHVGVPLYSAHNRLHSHAHFKLDYTSMPKRRSTRRQFYICGSIARSPIQKYKARSLSPQQKCACLATTLTASTVTSTGSAGLMAQQPAPGSSKSLRKRVKHRERPNQRLQASEDTNTCDPARRLSRT